MNSELNHESRFDPQPEPLATVPQSFFSRLIGVYFSPTETFREIGRAPSWLAPLLALALVSGVGGWALINRVGIEKFFRPDYDQAVERERMTQAQADEQMAWLVKYSPYVKGGFFALGFVISMLFALAVSGLAKLGSMMFGVENDFKPLLVATAYALLAVGLIGTTLLIILLYLKPAEEIDRDNLIGSNLTALLAIAGVKLPKFFHHLLGFVDVFTIWRTILLGIGFAAVSRRLKPSAAIGYTAAVVIIIALARATWGAIFG